MNAILQCFCNIEKFIKFFKYNKQAINLDLNTGNNLTFSFKLLIEQLWPNNYYKTSDMNNKSYDPKEFKDKISSMNVLLKGAVANEEEDLVNFIIMTLHEIWQIKI